MKFKSLDYTAKSASTFGHLKRYMSVLNRRDQKKIILIASIQSALGLLDLAAIALIAFLSSQSLGDSQTRANPGFATDKFEWQSNTGLLLFVVILLFISKSLASMYLTRRTLFFLARRGAAIGKIVNENLMQESLGEIEGESIQRVVFSLTSGISIITVQVLGSSVAVVSDLSVLVFLSLGLLIVDPVLFLTTFSFFSLVASLLFYSQNVRAKNLGVQSSTTLIRTQQQISNTILLYRDLAVRGSLNKFLEDVNMGRQRYSLIQAETNFLPQVGKYILEVSVMLGILLVGGVQFLRGNMVDAFATMSLLLVAGLRIIPALLRFQNSILQIQYGLGASQNSYDLIKLYSMKDTGGIVEPMMHATNLNLSIQFNEVTIRFDDRDQAVFERLNLVINPGEVFGVLGPSGTGKSTFADCIVGVRKPTSGAVLISGIDANIFSKVWPGKIGYVPQEVRLIEGTLRENIFLGIEEDAISDSKLKTCLFMANLDSLVSELPLGLETRIQDRGTNFSGGQRQRIGIARALLTSPGILILDEGTSALDIESEKVIMDRIIANSNGGTIILISHRPESFSRVSRQVNL